MRACLTTRRLRRLVAHGGTPAAVVLCGLSVSCGEPSRLPTVLPLTPSNDTFALVGTVTETAPTTSTTIPNAMLTLDGINSGTSTTSDESGRFSFGPVKGGRFNLVAARDGYQTGTFAIELKRDSDYAIRLAPEPPEYKDVTQTHTATLDWNVPPCQPAEYGCSHHYGFGVRWRGSLVAHLEWTGNAELELYLGEHQLIPGKPVGVGPGPRYSVAVFYRRGTEPAKYTLVMTHPN